MYNSMIARFALLCTFAFVSTTQFAATTLPASTCFEEDQMVTLHAGTTVSLELAQEVEISNVYVGNVLDFTVRNNVTVNGLVVIKAGSIAEGRVSKVEKSCDGKRYAITVIVDNVQAVDGQRVNVRSSQHTMKSNCCDGPAVINSGTILTSKVLDDIKIDA